MTLGFGSGTSQRIPYIIPSTNILDVKYYLGRSPQRNPQYIYDLGSHHSICNKTHFLVYQDDSNNPIQVTYKKKIFHLSPISIDPPPCPLGEARILAADKEIQMCKQSNLVTIPVALLNIVKEYLQPLYIINPRWKIVSTATLHITETLNNYDDAPEFSISSSDNRDLPFIAIQALVNADADFPPSLIFKKNI